MGVRPVSRGGRLEFTRLCSAYPGLRFTKRFILKGDELAAECEIRNLLDEERAFSYSCSIALLPPEGRATLRMPERGGGFSDTYCPGNTGDAFSYMPASRAFAVMDENGAGVALVAPARRVSGFYSWKGGTGRQATAEYFGVVERIPPKDSVKFRVAAVFSDNIMKTVAEPRFASEGIDGEPSSHTKVWNEPGTLKSRVLREGAKAFAKTFDVDLRRERYRSVYALDTDETDPAGLSVYPRLNGRTEWDRPLEVEPVVRDDGKVRLLVRVPSITLKDASYTYEYRRGYAFLHGMNMGDPVLKCHLVWNDSHAKHLPAGSIAEKPLATIPCRPRPVAEVEKERLENDFKIPLDLLGSVNLSNPPYRDPLLKPGKPVEILYMLQPGGSLIANGKWFLSALAAIMPIDFKTLVVMPEVYGVKGNKPYSVYGTNFGDTISEWTLSGMRAVGKPPRVALVQNLDFKIAKNGFTDILAGWNAAGTGIVLVNCKNVPEGFLGERDRIAESELLSSFPVFAAAGRNRQGVVEVFRRGDAVNASVTLDSKKNPATPEHLRGEPYPSVGARDVPYEEYALLAAARAVRMAAGERPAARIAALRRGGTAVVASKPGTFTLTFEVRSPEGFSESEFEREVPFSAPGSVVIEDEWFAGLPEGAHIVHAKLLSCGEAIDAAAFRVDRERTIRPKLSFSAEDRIYPADGEIGFMVSLSAVPQDAEIVAELEDCDFRIVRRERRPAAASASFAFRAPDPSGRIYRVIATVSAGGKPLARALEEVSVRMPPVDLSDTSAYITIPPSGYVLPLLKDLGFNFVICSFANRQAEGAVRNCACLGMSAIPRNCAYHRDWFMPYRGDNPGGDPVRKPCFSSPEYHKALRDRIVKRGNECRYDFYNVRYHWLGDECFLGSTVCSSPTCLAAFREELRGMYGTIEALNAEWGSSFGDFGDVVPCQLGELKSRDNLAPWLDHKMHMCRSFAANWIGGTKEALNEVSPGSLCGPTGTQQGGHGFDWAELMKYIDAIGYYGGCQRKLVHDFAEAYGRGILAGQCGGGYTHAHVDYEPYNYSTMWSGLLKGSNLAYHYYGAAIDGDMTATTNMTYWVSSMHELKRGIGKLFLSAAESSEVVALHSQNSLFTAMGTSGVSQWHTAQSSWWRVLSDLKVPFRYISREMLENGVPDGARVLVLPMTLAMSAKERASVAAFANRGGRVIADVAPGRFDEHGKLAQEGPLAAGWIETVGDCVAEYLSVDLGGPAGETESETGDSAAAAARARDVVAAALARGGVVAKVTVVDARGETYPCDAVWREDGPNGVFAMHVDVSGAGNNSKDGGTAAGRFDFSKGDRVKAKLPRKGHIYDLRTKEYLGFSDSVETVMIPGYTRIYSVLESKPGPLSASGPSAVAPGDRAVFAFSCAGASGAQTYHAELVAPDGSRPVRFWRNFRSDGTCEYAFESAFNEKRGEWKLEVRHVNSGQTAVCTFDIP